MCQNALLHFELMFRNEESCFVSKYRHKMKFLTYSPNQEDKGKKKIIKIDVLPEKGFYSEETIFYNRRMLCVKMLISGKKHGQC